MGEEHPDVAIAYAELAIAVKEQARLSEAEALLRRALVIQIRTLGENHPATAATRDKLATVLSTREQVVHGKDDAPAPPGDQ